MEIFSLSCHKFVTQMTQYEGIIMAYPERVALNNARDSLLAYTIYVHMYVQSMDSGFYQSAINLFVCHTSALTDSAQDAQAAFTFASFTFAVSFSLLVQDIFLTVTSVKVSPFVCHLLLSLNPVKTSDGQDSLIY